METMDGAAMARMWCSTMASNPPTVVTDSPIECDNRNSFAFDSIIEIGIMDQPNQNERAMTPNI